jgi:hypothetical protein
MEGRLEPIEAYLVNSPLLPAFYFFSHDRSPPPPNYNSLPSKIHPFDLLQVHEVMSPTSLVLSGKNLVFCGICLDLSNHRNCI